MRKRRIDVTMLDTHDTKMRVFVSSSENRAISGRRSYVIALGARISRVNKRLAAKDYAISIHKISLPPA